MAVSSGPDIVDRGLVLALDAADRNSFDEYENIITDSEFVYVQQSGSTVATANQPFVPYGRNTAVNFNNNGGAGDTYIYRNFNTSLASGTKYVISIFSNSSTLVLGQGGLASGKFTQISFGSITLSNGWYRHWVSYSATVNNPNITPQVAVAQGINVTLSGWQVETGTEITEYYQTGGTAKNRGSIMIDLTGRGNSGTLTNGPTYSNSNGGSIVFDGVDDYVNCGTPSISVGKITVNAWVKINAGSLFQHIVDSSSISSFSWHLAILGDNRPYFYNGSVYHQAAPILTVGQWCMLTGVQGTTLDIYINGVLGQSIATDVSVTTYDVNLGRFPGYGRQLNGNISQVQIYNRALSAAEIQQNYNVIKSRYIRDGDGSSVGNAAPSASYLVSLGITTNGYYYINLPTVGPTLIYCILDPAVDGGGWMVLWGAASGATNYTYSFSASRDDISSSPINGFYSLSYAKRSAINALCTQNKTLVYAGTNSNWLRFDGYIWNSNSHTSGNFRFEFNSSLVTSNGTVDSSVEVGLTNYDVSAGGDFGIAINTNGLDHHNNVSYYNLNNGCNSMYLYQYAAGYKVNTGLSGWYNSTAGCTSDNENDLPLLVAMK